MRPAGGLNGGQNGDQSLDLLCSVTSNIRKFADETELRKSVKMKDICEEL